MTGDYPTSYQLRAIKKWEGMNFLEFIELVSSAWNHHYGLMRQEKTKTNYYFATGGWSGNEEVIEAMRENKLFWYTCFYQHRTGGAYWFRRVKNYRKKK